MKWVRVALDNGDICSVVKIGGRIVGMGWASLVGDIGRVHTLYVKPQFRRMGIARDLLYARLTWLKSRHARSVFAEISHDNIASLAHVMKMGLTVSGQVFEYFNEEPTTRNQFASRPKTKAARTAKRAFHLIFSVAFEPSEFGDRATEPSSTLFSFHR